MFIKPERQAVGRDDHLIKADHFWVFSFHVLFSPSVSSSLQILLQPVSVPSFATLSLWWQHDHNIQSGHIMQPTYWNSNNSSLLTWQVKLDFPRAITPHEIAMKSSPILIPASCFEQQTKENSSTTSFLGSIHIWGKPPVSTPFLKRAKVYIWKRKEKKRKHPIRHNNKKLPDWTQLARTLIYYSHSCPPKKSFLGIIQSNIFNFHFWEKSSFPH